MLSIYSLQKEKKLYQKATQGLSNYQKHNGDSKEIIKTIERIQSKSEDFGWSTVATNIGPENANLFETPGKLKIQTCKLHCDLRWANSIDESNLQF